MKLSKLTALMRRSFTKYIIPRRSKQEITNNFFKKLCNSRVPFTVSQTFHTVMHRSIRFFCDVEWRFGFWFAKIWGWVRSNCLGSKQTTYSQNGQTGNAFMWHLFQLWLCCVLSNKLCLWVQLVYSQQQIHYDLSIKSSQRRSRESISKVTQWATSKRYTFVCDTLLKFMKWKSQNVSY